MAYTTLPAKATLKPTPFKVHISDEQISRCKTLVQLSELGPKTYENTTDDKYFGVTYEWMENAKQYWLDTYDWRKTEARINSYPNYTVDIPDNDGENYQLHFIALFSEKRDAVPIAFLHGWPGSFLEFLDFIDIVKAKYPTAADLPFHIVVPSQSGYAFSKPISVDKTVHTQDVARAFDKLMQGLGFADGYIAQGGDTGSFIARFLAAKFPSCKAAHLNMCTVPPPKDVPDSAIMEEEKPGIKRYEDFNSTGSAYAVLHRTRPSTIGFVLSSSPLALLAWVAEKFLTWSDISPPVSSILDSVSLYWYTQTFPTSIYHYRQFGDMIVKVEAPKLFGYASFPKDILPVPRAWVEQAGNLVWYKLHESGGHFAAMEKPKELLEDVEDFVAQVWPVGSKL